MTQHDDAIEAKDAEIARLTAENEALRAGQAGVTEAMVEAAFQHPASAMFVGCSDAVKRGLIRDFLTAALSARQGDDEA